MRRLRLATFALASAMAMPASAAITIANSDMDGKDTGAVTYAKETLRGAPVATIHGVKYYKVSTNTGGGGDSSLLDIDVPLTLSGPASVTYTFKGMVLGENLTDASLELGAGGSAGGTISLKGRMGDDGVAFTLVLDAGEDGTARLVLSVPSFAIPVDGSGSVEIVIQHATAESINVTYMFEDAVMVKSGIGEMSMDHAHQLSIDSGAVAFPDHTIDGSRKAHLGYFRVMSKENLYNADDGDMISRLVDSDHTAAPHGLVGGASAIVDGDFSFVEKATLQMSTSGSRDFIAPCAEADGAGDHRVDTDLTNDTPDPSSSEVENEIDSGYHHLCLYVDGETEIKAGGYMATVSYDKLYPDAVVEPQSSKHALGTIVHPNITFRIGFLSVDHPRRVHRIHLTNRTSEDKEYKFSFLGENGVVATNGPKYMGTVKAKETLVLRADEVVSLSDGHRVAAEVVFLNARGGAFDVTSAIANRDSGTQVVVEHQ